MAEHGYLTPDTIPSTVVCRVLRIPDDLALIIAVSGALLELTHPYNWEQFGTQTPVATAAAMATMLSEFWFSLGDECVTPPAISSFRHEESQGTAGGAITANSDQVIPFNATYGDSEPAVSLNANVFTVSPGVYFVDMSHVFWLGAVTDEVVCWLGESATPGNEKVRGLTVRASSDQHELHVVGILAVAASIDLKFYMRSPLGRPADGFGLAANIANHPETYGMCSFIRLHD